MLDIDTYITAVDYVREIHPVDAVSIWADAVSYAAPSHPGTISEGLAHSDIRSQYRLNTENMYGVGIAVSSYV